MLNGNEVIFSTHHHDILKHLGILRENVLPNPIREVFFFICETKMIL